MFAKSREYNLHRDAAYVETGQLRAHAHNHMLQHVRCNALVGISDNEAGLECDFELLRLHPALF